MSRIGTAAHRVTRAPLVLGVAVALVVGLTSVPAVTASAATPVPTPGPATPTARPAPPVPAIAFAVVITPAAGSTIGIAYPIAARFTAPVGDRATAEHHLHVYVNGRFSTGAWYWLSSTRAVFRTAGFWPGHAVIEVRMSLAGVEVGRSATARYVGGPSTTRTVVLRTARALVARVDGIKDLFYVSVDGRLVKVFKTSLGKPGYETRSGIKSVMEKYLVRHMTSIAAGITNPRDQYDLQVPYAVRITPTGEFVHGAPWATARLGRYNGSHGCTNLSVADAKWFFYNVLPGDPVVTTGTGRAMEYWNGLGAPYNMPWAQWLAHSALKGRP